MVSSMAKLGIKVYIPDRCYEEFSKFGVKCLSNLVEDIKRFLEEKRLL